MKFIYTALCVLMVSAVSCQNMKKRAELKEEGVPKAVQIAFDEKYPDENNPEWEVDAHGNYEAHFKKNGEKYRADFSEEGTWIETENDIKVKELPKVIRDKIDELYFFYTIAEVERVDHAEKGLFYDVEFKQKGKNLDIEFDPDGNQIN